MSLARDLPDLRKRLSRVVLAFDRAGNPVTTADLEVDGAMMAWLLEASKPNLIQTIEGQPATGSPQISVRITRNNIIKSDTPQNTTPSTAATDKGATEKPVIPSREYLNSWRRDHFVSPALRSTFSYSSHSVLKPTQLKIPFENRLYSLICNTASTIFRHMIR